MENGHTNMARNAARRERRATKEEAKAVCVAKTVCATKIICAAKAISAAYHRISLYPKFLPLLHLHFKLSDNEFF